MGEVTSILKQVIAILEEAIKGVQGLDATSLENALLGLVNDVLTDVDGVVAAVVGLLSPVVKVCILLVPSGLC